MAKRKKQKNESQKNESRKNPWTTLRTREVYDNPWIRVSESDVLTPAKTNGIYGVVHFKNVAVGVVALDDRERVLMVGQYRYALNRYSWEIPEGGCPIGTSALSTARRELKEETGYRAKKWSKLLELHLSNSSTDERAEVFLAQELEEGEAEPEETESLALRWVPLKRALVDCLRGRITDAITVAAILRVAMDRGLSPEGPSKGHKKKASLQKPAHRRAREKDDRHGGGKKTERRR